jgi:prepilin-type N-terminal cleavage/methylation domain-containing protein
MQEALVISAGVFHAPAGIFFLLRAVMLTKESKLPAGFTLVELMVVIFIIGVLAAVAVPYINNRIDKCKWSEGQAVAGTIRTAARSFCAKMGESYNYAPTDLAALGFIITPGAGAGDLDGKFFSDECYSIQFNGFNDYLITVDASRSLTGKEPSSPQQVTLDDAGKFSEIP